MANQIAIQAKGVQKHYGHIPALNGIDLQVEEGQIFGLIGANGAGKTTFIKLLIGATRADKGEMRVLGRDPRKHRASLRQQIGYMPQAPALYEDLSAAENLRFFGRAHQQKNLRESVESTLDFVELSQRAEDPVSTLSGGMKQRVSLACALVHQPRLLLLDEPTAGVDLKLRSAFWKHFKDLAALGTTILVSTHQMDEAVHCDRLAIISEGNIVADDTPQNLLQRGRAKATVWRKGEMTMYELQDYPVDFPKALHAYGLDREIDRIEFAANTLESTLLDLITAAAKGGK